ncbi:MAG TPA: hypothetical protein VF710_26950 [Longimicrobium sp.]|jgi:hypothetical protein
MTHKISLPLLLVLTLAACGGENAEKVAQRTAAHRAACVAEELAIQANTKISSLDTLRAQGPGFVNQVYPFSKAYFDYAKLRERHAALLDSAAAAESPEDSVRFTGEAGRNAPRPGQPGSIEANAAESYERDYAAAISNPDHPCNNPGGEEEK